MASKKRKHDKEGGDEEEEEDIKEQENSAEVHAKQFFICCGPEFGVFPFKVQESQYVKNIEGNSNAIFCAHSLSNLQQECPCSTSQDGIFTLPFPDATVHEVRALKLLCENTRGLVPFHLTRFPMRLLRASVNMKLLFELYDYFGFGNGEDTKNLKLDLWRAFLNNKEWQTSPLVEMTLPIAIGQQPLKDRNMHSKAALFSEVRLPLLQRLAYLHNTGSSHRYIRGRYTTKARVSALLGIEENILECLSPENCILSGSSVIKLALPQTQFEERSDVDLYVFNNSKATATLANLLQVLKQSGRKLFHTGLHVITAVGARHVRRIQIILTKTSKANELFLEFDFAALCAYYDGHVLRSTVMAEYAWITKTCITLPRFMAPIKPLRLLAMHKKGFAFVNKELDEEFIRETVGFDATREFPFLIYDDSAPSLEVQFEHLKTAFHLDLIQDEDLAAFAETCCCPDRVGFDPSSPEYVTNNMDAIFTKPLREFVKTCTFDEKFHYAYDYHRYRRCERRVQTNYCIEQKNGDVHDAIYIKHTPFGVTKKLEFNQEIQKELLEMTKDLRAALVASACPGEYWDPLFSNELDKPFVAKTTKQTQIFQNEVPSVETKDCFIAERTQVQRIILRPSKFYLQPVLDDLSNVSLRNFCENSTLKFICTHVFV